MAERLPGWVDGIDAAAARLVTGMTWANEGDEPADALRVRAGVKAAPGWPGEVRAVGDRVEVRPLQAVLPDPTGAGPYLASVDGLRTLVLTPRSQSLSRITLVLLQLTVGTEGQPNGVELRLLDGEPKSEPQRPQVPGPPHLVLASLRVPPVGPGEVQVRDERRYTVPAGGILPVRDLADRPVNPVHGTYTHRLDTGNLEVWGPRGWQTVDTSDSGWQPVALAAGWRPSATRPLQVRRTGRLVALSGNAIRASAAAPNRLAAELPAQFAPGGHGHVWVGHTVRRRATLPPSQEWAVQVLSAYRRGADGLGVLSLEDALVNVEVEVHFDATWSAH